MPAVMPGVVSGVVPGDPAAWSTVAGTRGAGVAVLLNVAAVVTELGFYRFCVGWIRRAHRRERECENPLHRAEISRRAAITQTVLVFQVATIGAVLVLVPWVVPRWLIGGWSGLLFAVALVAAVMLGGKRWRARREQRLDLTADDGCWL